MKSKSLPCLILANKARRSHPRVTELEVLVQIIQTVEEVSHMPAEYRQNSVVAVLWDESNKVHPHLIHELPFCYTEHLKYKTF